MPVYKAYYFVSYKLASIGRSRQVLVEYEKNKAGYTAIQSRTVGQER